MACVSSEVAGMTPELSAMVVDGALRGDGGDGHLLV